MSAAPFPPSAYSQGGGMPFGFWIVLALLVWFGLQWRASRRAVWHARADALAPVGRNLIADLVALFAPVIHRREIRRARGEMDQGIDDLLN